LMANLEHGHLSKRLPLLKKSKNRPKGILELKLVKVRRDVMRDYLIKKLIPAIQEKWLDEDEGRKIWIQ
jgi:hypothetical protein